MGRLSRLSVNAVPCVAFWGFAWWGEWKEATDANGKLQVEERTAPLPNGATGWHSIIVLVS
jgi:hypothetical protein